LQYDQSNVRIARPGKFALIKSRCPINFTVEIFGDTWSMLIVRDMAALGKRTFGEFLKSAERIGPSVLADRLAHLERKGIISKKTSETDRRKVIYSLTEQLIFHRAEQCGRQTGVVAPVFLFDDHACAAGKRLIRQTMWCVWRRLAINIYNEI
jgi:DNA-binding HxlR family transcriptional regulator